MVFALLLLPKCLDSLCHNCPCSPARDLGSLVSGLALLTFAKQPPPTGRCVDGTPKTANVSVKILDTHSTTCCSQVSIADVAIKYSEIHEREFSSKKCLLFFSVSSFKSLLKAKASFENLRSHGFALCRGHNHSLLADI